MSTTWFDYLELCKPKVIALMLITAIVGMFLATPAWVPLNILIFGTVGIALCAGSAAVVNHLVDRRIDSMMKRTRKRPIARGKIKTSNAIVFAGALGMTGMLILIFKVNTLTAWLTFAALIGYAGIYTGYLKHATSQNIVIGGLAGAAPPLLGWTAVTGHIVPESLLLVLIIFIWTPPHFWALAIHHYDDYALADVPMLPVTHGIPTTKQHILVYTILLVIVSLLPTIVGMSGLLYLAGAIALGTGFLYWAIRLKISDEKKIAMQTFRFSINYLLFLFVFMLADHYLILR